MSLLQDLLQFEETLLRLGPACDRTCMERLLAEDFEEFGSSGRVWSRETILEELERMKPRDYTLQDAKCIELAESAAMVTYRVRIGERETLRSSLWVKRDGRWQMRFHQGTLVP